MNEIAGDYVEGKECIPVQNLDETLHYSYLLTYLYLLLVWIGAWKCLVYSLL